MSIFDLNQAAGLGVSRRNLLKRAGGGFGMLALAALLDSVSTAKADEALSPLWPKRPDFPARAKSVIWLFMEGGPSGFDLFDYKPGLEKMAGKRIAGVNAFFGSPGPVLPSPYTFKQYGQSGMWVCDRMPNVARCVDDIAFIRSCHADSNSHAPAMYQMNTGSTRPGFPSAGAWAAYGLGSENQNLPGFVVMPKQDGIKGGAGNWGSGFLPGAFQGTLFRSGENPILNLKRAPGITDQEQRSQLDLARSLNEEHLASHAAESDLEARIASFELAYRMQFEATEAVDISKESEETRNLYGIGEKESNDYGSKLLMARRLVERGVRFIQCYPSEQWDAHDDLKANHDKGCALTDKPIAGLLTDLKRRGLLDSTLVIWGGEFGRLPVSEKGKGRDHNPHGFLTWMAGGGIKGGVTYGATDDLGFYAVDNPVSIPDLHATILHAMGLDHLKLTYLHNGRRFRLTDVSGEVLTPILV
jgi:Protein of unknown function (DUF1501)